MAENSKIEWTHHTFNPWHGCAKVSPGCDNCYAERDSKRFNGDKVLWGVNADRKVMSEYYWKQPIKWNKRIDLQINAWDAIRETYPTATDEMLIARGFIKPQRERVFCASMADVFDKNAPEGQRDRLWALIKATPNLDWLILTKRIGNAKSMLPDDWADGYPNVWLGITVVNQEEADRDIPKLIDVPAKIRFLSMEPLLSNVDILKWLDPWTCADCEFHGSEKDCGPDGCEKCGEGDAFSTTDVCKSCGADDQATKHSCPHCGSHRSFEQDSGFKFSSERKLIDWVIVGGESGPNARPMHPDWCRSLRDQCASAGVPLHMKQMGGHPNKRGKLEDIPEDLRYREFPK